MATGEVLAAGSWNETPVQLAADGRPTGFRHAADEASPLCSCGHATPVDGPG